MDFATALTTLNKRLDDADNFTFSNDEKTEALTEAFDDPYVMSEVYDTSTITFTTGTQVYDVSSIVDTVLAVSYDSDGDGFYDDLPGDAFEMVTETQIKLNTKVSGLKDGKVLAIKGLKKTTTDDNLPANLEDYVLKLGQLNCLYILMNKKVNRFLRNDTSMADIAAAIDRLEAKVREYRTRFRRQYEAV